MPIDKKKIEEWKAFDARVDDNRMAGLRTAEAFARSSDSVRGVWAAGWLSGATGEIDALRSALPVLLDEREEMLAVLREVEWGDKGDGYLDPMCPICERSKAEDHASDCRLAAFLR